MARPPSGPPPVQQSAVIPAEDRPGRRDLQNYIQVVKAFEREDRRAELLAMFGGDQGLVDRFLAVAFNSIATNSDLLLNCTTISIVQAIKDSATLGLEPTGLTGEATIIKYGSTATLTPMWRGYLKRIRNSKKVQDIDVQIVYDADEFDYGWNQNGGWFTHHPAKPSRDDQNGRGGYWGAYAYAVMPSGFVELEVMTETEINYVRDTFSPSVKAGRPSPWDTSWGEMSRKTVLRRVSKRLPQEAVEQLLMIDALADQAADEEKAATVKVSESPARRAALKALGRSQPGDEDIGLLAAPVAADGHMVDDLLTQVEHQDADKHREQILVEEALAEPPTPDEPMEI